MPEWHQVVDDLAEPSEIEVEQDGRRALLRTAPGPTIGAFAEPSVSPSRRYSRDSHALQQRPDAPKRWCLNPNGRDCPESGEIMPPSQVAEMVCSPD
jgi:hypothetical protein